MRISDFWRLMDDEFGPAYSRVLAADLVLGQLGGVTASEALGKGMEPKSVWLAVCDIQDVPPERRLGRDVKPKAD
ncbi:DUF3046 domain-containing protein [Arthrobacter yangruifuii]|uniref:DUF3046 domain-containing protein n=1 Tax=Arthrobacter yangruifuii TaxID=2606616 RepID=A0A5N6MGE8_9MICC|nr:DUF3046 domain-containing protein [Arthrobacter yangruifuii]KAD3515407.1 DUF3046 domain-containing protein [Arthrobacter yangruifuii]